MSCFRFDANGSGITHAGLNASIVRKLGTMDDFVPDGASTMKLCAKAGFSGSCCAYIKSRYMNAAIR